MLIMPKKTAQKKSGALGLFKELAPIVKRVFLPHKKVLLAVAFFSLVVAASDALIPFFAGRFFDALISIASGAMLAGAVFLPLASWLVLKIFSDVLSWRIDRKQGVLGADIESEYVSDAFSRLLEKPLEFHKKSKGGEMQQRIHKIGRASCRERV